MGKGRTEFLQKNIIESMYRSYIVLDWKVWLRVYKELLEDSTILYELKRRGLHVSKDNK